ncbi:uncharacterized protein LOC108876339 [Lates calcarifer]|uniref:Uncharacterized protein LOC108876339 n=1 Tax=Lates calcarifer TaxID=8187 RepID=A0AAJ7LGK2_LATCA|nr:uncharacterized protein LOC108876339 [Lates calcarifer]XP_018521313.1 uncharacterized protein LOC108876339 [Lates calcarifer]
MDVADMLIDKIFSWVHLQKKGAKKLRKLATELEKDKKNVNISKVVGSSVSVGGAVAMTAAGALAFFTGGAAIPVLAVAGSVATGLGLATNVSSEVVGAVMSSCTMKEAKEISEKIQNLEEGIQKLMNTLKEEGEKREQEAGNHLSSEDYVVERILRAMAKRSGLKLHDDISLWMIMSSLSKYTISGEDIALGVLKCSALLSCALLSQFVLKAVAKKTGKFLISKGVSIGGKSVVKAAGRIVGGSVGLLFSVPELITNCVNLDNCETEASQVLREIAETIRTASEELEKELDEIKQVFQRLAKVKCCIENTKRSSDERKILIEFAMENCQDETIRQWLRENSESKAFFRLVDMFHLLKEGIDKEEKKNHSNEVDITFLAHGAITGPMIRASCLLPLPTITDVELHSPWNCVITADAGYGIATGKMKPQDRVFYRRKKDAQSPDESHGPMKPPNHWNSMKKSVEKNQEIPNIILSPFKPPKDGYWKEFEYLINNLGPPGRNRIAIPYILPEKRISDSSERVPFYVVTLALSLALFFSRFTAKLHLAACLGDRSAGQKLDKEYLAKQYACSIEEAGMCLPDIKMLKWFASEYY